MQKLKILVIFKKKRARMRLELMEGLLASPVSSSLLFVDFLEKGREDAL